MKRVSLVTAYNDKGELLLGRRNDVGAFTLAGGSANEGETDADAARRELLEETGLTANSLSPLTTITLPSGTILSVYSAYVNGEPHGKLDPDQECEEWKFYDVSKGLPEEVANNLYGPKSADLNIVRKLFENDPHVEDSFEKAENLDEVHKLLSHPDATERLLTLRLNNVNSEHLAHAALDPEESVHDAAVNHHHFDAGAAMHVMEAQADHSGKFPLAQKLKLLDRHDKISPFHVSAAAQSADIAPYEQGQILHGALVAHPKLPQETAQLLYDSPNLSYGNRLRLLDHPDLPPEVPNHALKAGMMAPGLETEALANKALFHTQIDQKLLQHAISLGVNSRDPHLKSIAKHALAHGLLPPGTVEYITQQAKLFPDDHHMDLLASALQNSSATTQHVDEALTLSHPKAIGAVLGARASNINHFNKIQDRLDKEREKAKPAELAKAEDIYANLQEAANSQLAHTMYGLSPQLIESYQAVQFLAGGREVPFEAVRKALVGNEECPDSAALRTFGFEVCEENLNSVNATKAMLTLEKKEVEPMFPHFTSIAAASPEGDDVAEEIRKALKDRYAFYLLLAGKHGGGSFLARDEEDHQTWLLKPGSGSAGGAAGATDDSATQSAREACFYHVAKDWGLEDAFARAELIYLDGQPYAAIAFVGGSYETVERRRKEDPNIARKLFQGPLHDGLLHQWSTLYFVLGDPDGHGQNVLSNNFGELRFIDHGSAFAGDNFDPANDGNSFTPYFLRAWAPQNFKQLPPDQKLKYLPEVNRQVRQELGTWLNNIDCGRLGHLLASYGIDAQPTLKRLQKVKELVTQGLGVDQATNRLWVTV